MKKMVLLSTLLGLFLFGVLVLPISAQEEASVTYTATAKLVAVSVFPTTGAYGVMNTGTSDVVPSPDTGFEITNDGNVDVDMFAKGSDFIEPVSMDTWALGASQGINQCVHKVAVGPTYEVLQTLTTIATDTVIAVGVPPSLTESIKSRFSMPTEVNNGEEHSGSITILAVEGI